MAKVQKVWVTPDAQMQYAVRSKDGRWFRRRLYGRLWGEWIACRAISPEAAGMKQINCLAELPDD